MKPSLILINPWIYDFSAYDLWSKPFGLLCLAGWLRESGFNIHFIDCLDIHHPDMTENSSLKPPKRHLYGTGKFWREVVPKPSPLQDIPRPYSRYGLLPEVFEQELRKIRKPSAILITALMTYWYPGVMEAIRLAKRVHPGVPVILGGIYARLCHEHAVINSGADSVVSGHGKASLLAALDEYGIRLPGNRPDLRSLAYPAFDLLTEIDYVCMMTSSGCPYRCQYCASHFLQPERVKRDPDEVLEEIVFWHQDFAVQDFAFYDDALLVAPGNHAGLLFEGLARLNLNLRFHTPNALHVREITGEISRLLHRTGFRTIRLGLETSDLSLHRDLDNKLSGGDFERAMHNLLEAGFDTRQIGAYILIGLPGQTVDSVIETINFAGANAAIPYLSEYSPIPHTPLWEKAVACSEHDLSSEPLFHNNTLLPCWDEAKKKELLRLKRLVSEIRERYR
ncbi:MAG: cobalamin-dependent protein [Proteobacteria bacterium]|nr:cobalamin B12-binding domain-containing protein [Desulfobacterales bacterium]MBL7101339.1 cobalamin-dependent protein [Desulfobacteraceae bacterium]MBU1905324.1 cobalamin-dependent protein [Pseudomonadota bacterium]